MKSGYEAVKHCGMLAVHAEIFSYVADDNDMVIATRELNHLCEGLIAEGHASKGFHIKAKSCSWGPMAGMVLAEAKFSKEKNLEKQRKWIADAIHDNAGREVVFISTARIEYLIKEGILKLDDKNQAYQSLGELMVNVVSPINESYVFRATRERSQEPMWKLSYQEGAKINSDWRPVVGLTNPKGLVASGVQPVGPLSVVAGDYDLFCMWFKNKKIDRPMPTVPRIINEGARLSTNDDYVSGIVKKRRDTYLDLVKRSQTTGEADKHRGNLGFEHIKIINLLNLMINEFSGYKGGNMIHHGDETGNPFSAGEDYPLLFFIPNESPVAIENASELRDLMTRCEQQGFVIDRNNRFNIGGMTSNQGWSRYGH
jgi:hypothetical protein